MDPPAQVWSTPTDSLVLYPGVAHVWRVALNPDNSTVSRCEEVLNEEELARADRFNFARDKRRYIVKQAHLKMILGKYYLGCDPRALEFDTNPYGKPFLSGKGHAKDLSFNVSDSNEMALLAVCIKSEIGIDVEFVRSVPDADQISAQFFSQGEHIEYKKLYGAKKQEAFFNCWTRKEAFIKAIGKGLSYPLKQVEVSVVPGDQVRVISISGDADKAKHWSLVSMVPAPGYLAAIAVRPRMVDTKFFERRQLPI